MIVAFTDVTASTFLGRIEELDGVPVRFNAGGAVAFASGMAATHGPHHVAQKSSSTTLPLRSFSATCLSCMSGRV